eukprot:GILI01018221.1.p1 GENE.GILI01018221.1~~GILI01018221.1.p1  ORF type:complete len:283 (-),score=95.06 GILI01018221.1:188-1036(-)
MIWFIFALLLAAPVLGQNNASLGANNTMGGNLEAKPAVSSCEDGVSLNVEGFGSVQVQPDTALVRMVIYSRGMNPDETSLRNKNLSMGVIKAISQFGIKNVQTADYRIQNIPACDGPFCSPYSRNQQIFEVRNTLLVTSRNLTGLGDLFDYATKNGVAGIEVVSFYVKDASPFVAQAQTIALSSALNDLHSLAKNLGVTDWEICDIQQSKQHSTGPYFLRVETNEGGSADVQSIDAIVRINAMLHPKKRLNSENASLFVENFLKGNGAPSNMTQGLNATRSG